MTQAEPLAESFQGLYSNHESCQFPPLSISMHDIPTEKTARSVLNDSIPFGSQSIMYVLAVVHAVTLARGEDGKSESVGRKNGSLPVPPAPLQMGWEFDQERMFSANQKLATLINMQVNEYLDNPAAADGSSLHQVIQRLIVYNSYYSSEVISSRHIQGLWLETT